jgi:hypothetical protein
MLATGQEFSRDRKAEFESSRDAMVGAEVLAWCGPNELSRCGHLIRKERTQNGREYTFDVVPPGCSYAIAVGYDDRIASWRYVSEPGACWKFFLAPP